MIFITPEHRLTITLTNTEGANDITHFCNIVTKCYKESKKAGFTNMFTGDEKDVILSLAGNLGLDKESTAEGFKEIRADYIHVPK